jgi:hypothetical protein
VHEDEPDRTAEVLLNFVRRFGVGQPVGRGGLPEAVPGVPRVLPVAAGPAFERDR